MEVSSSSLQIFLIRRLPFQQTLCSIHGTYCNSDLLKSVKYKDVRLLLTIHQRTKNNYLQSRTHCLSYHLLNQAALSPVKLHIRNTQLIFCIKKRCFT